MPISLILITSVVEIAEFALESDVDFIMLDLEIIGKHERQANRDTLISAHSIDDVRRVASAVDSQRLIVRTNDLHDGIAEELNEVLAVRPAYVMLPMARNVNQVREYAAHVAGRSQIVTLVETVEGVRNIAEIAALPEVSVVYIGLNDLHLDMNLKFMFEPLANGVIDDALSKLQSSQLPFGFGGIARMDEGDLPGKLVLSEHVRLRSSFVILSRTFHRRKTECVSLAKDGDFVAEIAALRAEESKLNQGPVSQLEGNRRCLIKIVESSVRKL